MMTARLAARDVLEEGMHRARELEGLHPELDDAAPGAAGGLHRQADKTRLGAGQIHVAALGAGRLGRVDVLPRRAVTRDIDAETARRRAGQPIDDQAAVLALLAEVDRRLGLYREALDGFRLQLARTPGDAAVQQAIRRLERMLEESPPK